MPDDTKCCETVHVNDGSRFGWSRKCSKKATVTRDGKRFCGTHDPEKVKARDEKSRAKWRAREDEQRMERRRARNLDDAKDQALQYLADYLPFLKSTDEAEKIVRLATENGWSPKKGE